MDKRTGAQGMHAVVTGPSWLSINNLLLSTLLRFELPLLRSRRLSLLSGTANFFAGRKL